MSWMRYASLMLLGFFVLTFTTSAKENVVEPRIKESEERIKKDLSYLASDELEGRGPTTKGINKAADYIADHFKKLGLKPVGQAGTYFQHFTIPGARLMQAPTLTFAGPKSETISPEVEKDFHAMGLANSGAVKDVGLVFAGYGVSSDKFDEYKDLEVAGKVLIVLRDAPGFLGAAKTKHAAFVEKMAAAEKRDALAILFVNDSESAKDGDELLNFGFTAAGRAGAKLPAFHFKRAVIDKILAASNLKPLATLEAAILDKKEPQSAPLKGWTASLDLKVKRDGIELKNVIGVLEGKGPKADETVVIGAHYDHLGYGGQSSLARLKKPVIHNGADDNASGTCGMMELARRFAAVKDREGRRLVFMAFSGEELGLLGSAHYCKTPIFPIENTVAMINLDMIGRLTKNAKSGKDTIQVWGTGTAKTFDKLIDDHNKKYGFELQKKPTGFGPSDHSSFYEKKVPVIFFFTGDHSDYHRPSDDFDKVNYDGLRRIVDLSEELATKFATEAERPEYVKVAGGSTGPRPSIRLGIRPGYIEDKEGVLVESVSEGDPAAKAGIKGGDRIIKMGDAAVKNIEQYMLFMGKQKKGDTIDVTLIRAEKELKLKVKLE